LRAPRAWDARAINESVVTSQRRRAVSWEYRLSPDADSIGKARRHVRYALEPYADAETLDNLELVVSELVTNAVRHGPGDVITLRLVTDSDGAIAGDVADGGRGQVAIREREPYTEGGLGLPIVDALTSEWGVHPGSTHVWFRFSA
jgi:anti-sigma regulatory factor (Ser/Thr protein kinase)